jgi:hypothetical protein
MMSRLRQLRSNTSTIAVVQVFVVSLVFVFIGVMLIVGEREPTPLICLLVGAAVPVLLRRRLTDHPEASGRLIRSFGLGLFITCLVFGAMKAQLREVIPDPLLIDGIALLVGLYLGCFVVLFSDPSIVRVR